MQYKVKHLDFFKNVYITLSTLRREIAPILSANGNFMGLLPDA